MSIHQGKLVVYKNNIKNSSIKVKVSADLVGKQSNRQSSVYYILASTMPEESSEETIVSETTLKNKRKQVREKITRIIKRLNEGVTKEDKN